MKEKICILNYGSGNQRSLYNFISHLGYIVDITGDLNDIKNSSHLLLPGVGSYIDLMQRLRNLNFLDILNEYCLIKKKPFLGICVGMQILSTFGNEFNRIEGLNFINGNVRKINSGSLKLPHIGWNNVVFKENKYFDIHNLQNLDFYFLHSFIFEAKDPNNVIGFTDYGEDFPSIINKENIWGFQFHPEKSQKAGEIILKKFFQI